MKGEIKPSGRIWGGSRRKVKQKWERNRAIISLYFGPLLLLFPSTVHSHCPSCIFRKFSLWRHQPSFFTTCHLPMIKWQFCLSSPSLTCDFLSLPFHCIKDIFFFPLDAFWIFRGFMLSYTELRCVYVYAWVTMLKSRRADLFIFSYWDLVLGSLIWNHISIHSPLREHIRYCTIFTLLLIPILSVLGTYGSEGSSYLFLFEKSLDHNSTGHAYII